MNLNRHKYTTLIFHDNPDAAVNTEPMVWIDYGLKANRAGLKILENKFGKLEPIKLCIELRVPVCV